MTLPFVALAVALVGSPAAPGGEAPGCRPTFVEVSAESLVVRFHPLWEVTFNGILIGCQADLDRIDDGALADLQERLRAIAHEKHFNLYRKARRPEFRGEVCRELNTVLGEDLVSDIYFHELGLAEYRPIDPEEGPEEPLE